MQACSVHLSAPTSTAVREQTGPKCAACEYCRHVAYYILCYTVRGIIFCISLTVLYTLYAHFPIKLLLFFFVTLWLSLSFKNVYYCTYFI